MKNITRTQWLHVILQVCLCFNMTAKLQAQDIEHMIKSRPVSFSGSLDVTTAFYNASGIPGRYLPFNYYISGSPVLTVYGMQIPFSFIIGKQQSSYMQPFNQFGLSPSYKWITVHAGYRNLNYSPFTLAGHTFLGAGIELRPGKFRFSAMYGQFNKATPLDTTQSLYFNNFSYKRTGMAASIGLGTDNSFFDLIVLKAKDDPSSIKAGMKGLADSSGISPAENTVTGYNTRISIWKQRLVFESNGALSLYTNDINATAIADSNFDKTTSKLRGITRINSSSALYSAIQASIRYKTKFFSLRLQYMRIDPGFQSMGAYFLNNDLENYTVAPAFTGWKNKLRFSGSLGIQRDNLLNNKRAGSRKVIGSANISADLTTRFGVDLSYSDYSMNQSVKTIRFADSLRLVQSNRQLSFTPRYLITGTSLSHSIMFSANICQAKEVNPTVADSLNGDINTNNYILNYQLSFIQQAASAFISLNHTQMKSNMLTDQNMGVTLGVSKAWQNGKLNLSASGGYLLGRRNDEKSTILNGSLQCRYRFHNRHSLHLSAYYTGNKPDHSSASYPQYSEIRSEAGYSLSF